MEKEAPQKLLGREGHLSLLIVVCIIFPAEGDLIVLEGQQTVVGDGNAMSIAGKITQHMRGDRRRGAWHRRPSSDGIGDARKSERLSGFLAV